MKPWHQVVSPHPDIRAGKFDRSVFAADLSDAIAGRGLLQFVPAKSGEEALKHVKELAQQAEAMAKAG